MTEQEANKYLKDIEEDFIDKFGKVKGFKYLAVKKVSLENFEMNNIFINKFKKDKGFKYLAVKKDFLNEFEIEFGYSNRWINPQNKDKIIKYLNAKMPKEEDVFRIRSFFIEGLSPKIRERKFNLKKEFDFYDLNNNTKINNEIKINKYLKEIESEFINKFGKEENFKYLAIKNNSEIEFGYSNKFMNPQKKEEIINFFNTKKPIIESKEYDLKSYVNPKFSSKGIVQTSKRKEIKERDFKNDEEFDFYNLKNNDIKTGDKITGYETGTLGSIITLDNYKNEYFIISNAHVLLGKTGKTGKIGNKVFKNNLKIGEVFWGVFNEYYDVAIAKIDKKFISLNKIKSNQFKLPSMMKIELLGISSEGEEKGNLYSKNAIVKIKKYIFKNQILISNNKLKHGDSGTIIIEKKSNSPIGLFIGGDSYIKVANNLFNLFNTKIPAIKDRYGDQPSIQFKNFINLN